MIDRIQYSDFNKFLVSTGYLLIALGVLLPYFFLKEDLNLNIEQVRIDNLTKSAKEIIIEKQNFSLIIIKIIPYFSGMSVITGIVFLFIGGKKWKIKQNEEDFNKNKKNKQEILKLESENKKSELEYELLKNGEKITKTEILKNREIEIEKETPDITKNEKYLSAQSFYLTESLIAEKFKKEYSGDYNVLSNYRINNHEFDIILSSINNDTNKLDLSKDRIVEIKYTARKITKKYVIDTLEKVASLIKVYPKALTNPIVIFVRLNDSFPFNEDKIRLEIEKEWSAKTIRKWNLLFLNINEIPELNFRDKLNI